MAGARDRGLQDFVASRFGGLRRAAYLMCGDWEIAEDLVCAVLAEIVLDGRTAGADAHARRAVLDGFSGGWRTRRRERVFAANPDDTGADAVVQLSVLAGLSRLPPRQRAIVVLRHWEGLGVDEVAEVLGVAAETVRSHEALGLAALHDVRDLLGRVFDAEPTLADPVTAVYRRAHRLRRHRARTVLVASVSAVMSVALVGHLLTGVAAARMAMVSAQTLQASPAASISAPPTPAYDTAATPPPDSVDADPFAADPVGARVLAAVTEAGLRLRSDRVARGIGWRRYAVVDPSAAPAARPRGTVQIVVYTLPGGACFPVLSARERVCAWAERTDDGNEFVRYADDAADPPFHEVITRRRSDGLTVAVVVAGSPAPDSSPAPDGGSDASDGGSDASDDAGRPALSALEVTTLATDPGLMDAFGADEWCDLPHPQCPSLRVPLPMPQHEVPATGA